VLTDRSFDANLIDVLREVAQIGNFVFEIGGLGQRNDPRVDPD